MPEIYDGIVEVKAVARDPGSRAKIAVVSNDSSIDPVGACVGMRGSRVQAVVNELQGEKIDIIPWSPDAATFIVNALQPAEVMKVVLDEDTTRIEVVVPDDQLSLAIGRRGQNVRLASQLTGWDIDILTEAEESERRQKEFAERTHTFMEALDVDETVAQLLASEGFRTVEEIAYVELAELASIEGFDGDTAAEIQARANGILERIEAEHDDARRALGVADELKEIEGLTTPMLVKLGQNDVKTVEDLAGCATDDLIGWTEKDQKHLGFLADFDVSREQAEAIIMAARVKAGWIEATPEPAETDGDEDGGRGLTLPARLESDRDRRAHLRRHRREGRAGGDAALCASPAGVVTPDIRRKLPGRGVWTRLDAATVARAAAKGGFARGFRRPVKVGGDLADEVDGLLADDALQMLALVNKSGLVVAGAAKVEAALRSGRVVGAYCTPARRAATGSTNSTGWRAATAAGLQRR